MVLKRGLSAALAFSLATSAMLPFAAEAQAVKSDSVVLILRALSAKTPAEAKTLLQQAEDRLSTEDLPADSQEEVRTLLAQARAKYSPNNLSAKKLINLGGSAAAPVPSLDTASALADALAQNPAVHAALKEISEGRLERDSGNLKEILGATSQSITAADQSNGAVDQILSAASSFIKSLRDHGLVKDWSVVNRALKAKHPSLSMDELANYAIADSIQWSILAGIAKKMILTESPSMFRNGGAVTAEAFGTFVVNVNMVLRIADIYGMNLAEHEADTTILVLLPVGKILGHFATRNKAGGPSVAEKISGRLGELFAEVRTNPNPSMRTKFLVQVFSSAMMAGALKRTVGFDAKAAGAAPIATAGKIESSIAALEADAAKAESAAASASKVAKSSVGLWGLATRAFWGTVQAGGETLVTGIAAKYWFKYQKTKERALQTRDFKKFMEEKNARGFFKLLIATANAGTSKPRVIDPRTAKDNASVKFIMGIARSIRICSPHDAQEFKDLKAKWDAHLITSKTKNFDYQYRLLRFQCDTNLGFSQYDQIVNEFMTFNAIPDLEVAQLRLASYEQRMQMGELLMQLLFMINKTPSSAQLNFFDTTVAKFLGLTRTEDATYFSRYYGFIHGQGGMTEDASNATGWAVRTTVVDDPYTSTGGYTDPTGPDLPSPPVAGPAL